MLLARDEARRKQESDRRRADEQKRQREMMQRNAERMRNDAMKRIVKPAVPTPVARKRVSDAEVMDKLRTMLDRAPSDA